MKHIFIANPVAGAHNAVPHIRAEVERLCDHYDCTVYETTGKGDATIFVREYIKAHPEEEIRFYACGGDGTLNEVMSGMVGFAHASLSCYPCGSGNDFVKYYGGVARFLSLERLVEGKEENIDLITDGQGYSINVANFGFDYAVARRVARVKRLPFLHGKNAYYFGVVRALFTAMRNKAKVFVDGERIGKGDDFLLCTVANGSYVGGSFRCAPRSDNGDGLLEVCLVSPVSLPSFLKLMGAYRRGEHLDDPRFSFCTHYRRGKKVEVISEQPHFGYTLDGELVESGHFTFEVMPKALRFAVPALALNAKTPEPVLP